jgi:peptidoglycan/xylan/chitin deacetylase (PgdA/CDA1 family)
MTEPTPIRPDLAEPNWPAGFRMALSIMITIAPPDDHPLVSYAPAGTERLLRVLDDVGVRATTIWTPAAALRHTALLSTVQEAGHDLAISVSSIGDPRELSAALAELATRVTGTTPGLILPESARHVPDRLVAALGETGFGWIGDPVPAADLPSIATGVSGSRVVRLPLTPGTSDTGFDHGWNGDHAMLAWRDDLDVIRDEGAFLSLQLSSWRTGRPGPSRALGRFLDYAIDLGDLWLARMGDVANWWSRRTADQPQPTEGDEE